jgi:hypothetical protein
MQSLHPAPILAHTLSQFDADLESVRSLTLEMGGLVEQQVQRALDAFVTGDLRIADEVVACDRRVNAMQVSIDESPEGERWRPSVCREHSAYRRIAIKMSYTDVKIVPLFAAGANWGAQVHS